MTTIAWDGKTLAVDSLRCMGDIIEDDCTQKLFVGHGTTSAITGCGKYENVLAFVAWVSGRCKDSFPTDKDDACGAGIVITGKGQLYRYPFSGNGDPIAEGNTFTDGSGWMVALGALDAGATAEEAVKVAIKRDVYTGGEVQIYTYE